MAEFIQAINHTDFFYKAIQLVLEKGISSSPRGLDILEVENVVFQIELPYQKQLFVPLRGNDPFATMAEALWVLAGRNDLEYLAHYLPRAREYSDDGKTWRGGYGPRLRNWNTIDQLKEVIKILEDDRDSRRAVMMIFDPDRDFVASKDIPCNNQLAFTIRDNKLNVKVCSRSMDILWGSTVNIITWSILQELIAGIMHAEAGTLTYFISSFHLYTSFLDKVEGLLTSQGSSTPYTELQIPIVKFDVYRNLKDFDGWITAIMAKEEEIRKGMEFNIPTDSNMTSSQILYMFIIRRCLSEGNLELAKQTVLNMVDTDFTRALSHFVFNSRL
jgi:thymidylate synthase